MTKTSKRKEKFWKILKKKKKIIENHNCSISRPEIKEGKPKQTNKKKKQFNNNRTISVCMIKKKIKINKKKKKIKIKNNNQSKCGIVLPLLVMSTIMLPT